MVLKGVCSCCKTGGQDLVSVSGETRLAEHKILNVVCSGSLSAPLSVYDPERLMDPKYAAEKLAGVEVVFVSDPV